ncbi:hypothetical protein BMS3Abin03_01140 [bacterium BMS3Abin03]|nr:hypothetical protein BMS3Abin03_01140 [bacterium BMS3Abin03]
MNKISTIIFCILFTSMALSQQLYEEVVYLKNGSVIKGTILEQVPDVSVKIQTKDGNIFVYKMEEIDRITKELVQTSKQTDDFVTNGIEQNLAGKFCLSGFGGLAFPMGDLADDNYKNEDAAYRTTGPQFGLSVEYFFIPNFGIGAQFNYVSMGSKEYDWIGDKPNQDDVFTMLLLGAHGKYIFISDGKVRPYGKFGLGMVMSSLSDSPVRVSLTTYRISDVEIDTKFYLHLATGVNFFVSSQISLFAELTYNYEMMDGAKMKFTDISGNPKHEITANYYYFGLIAGVNIWLGGTD